MKVNELKELLDKYPDDAEVFLCDVTTDDDRYSTYYFDESDVQLEPVYDDGMELIEEVVAICFVNRLNPNPLPSEQEL